MVLKKFIWCFILKEKSSTLNISNILLLCMTESTSTSEVKPIGSHSCHCPHILSRISLPIELRVLIAVIGKQMVISDVMVRMAATTCQEVGWVRSAGQRVLCDGFLERTYVPAALTARSERRPRAGQWGVRSLIAQVWLREMRGNGVI